MKERLSQISYIVLIVSLILSSTTHVFAVERQPQPYTPFSLQRQPLAKSETTPSQAPAIYGSLGVYHGLIHGHVMPMPANQTLRVELLRPTLQFVQDVFVDRQGYYRFNHVPLGRYILRVSDEQDRAIRLLNKNVVELQYDGIEALVEHDLLLDLPDTQTVAMPNPQSTLAGGGQIRGRVTAADTGAPMQGILVDALGSFGGAITDATGMYTLTIPSDGSYRVRFRPQYSSYVGYLPQYYNNQLDVEKAQLISVTNGIAILDIDAVLVPGGRITGQVLAADTGLPLTGAIVIALDGFSAESGSGVVDATGFYTITGLFPGPHYILFAATTLNYVSSYYNNRSALVLADSIAVTASYTVTGINANLIRGGQIKGRVTDAHTGLPTASVTARAYNSFGFVSAATPDASGFYTLTGLPSGGYRLRFTPPLNSSGNEYIEQYYNNKSDQPSADIVNVVSPNVVKGIDMALSRGAQITGTVTAADTGLPLSDVNVNALDCSGNYAGYGATNAGYGYTDSNGHYVVKLLMSGSYRVQFNTSSGNITTRTYIPSYYNNQAEFALGNDVSVTAPHTLTNISAVLMPGAQVRGRVTAADTGLGLPNVRVSVRNASKVSVGPSVVTDATGNYTVTTLPSGNYNLTFSPRAASFYTPTYQYVTKLNIPLSVTAPNIINNFDVILERGGQISGRPVTALGGVPSGGTIRLYDSNGVVVKVVSTDDTAGYYTFFGVSTGSYRLSFDPMFNSSPQYNYIRQFYSNQLTLATANVISVTAPASVSNIDFAVTRGGSILGFVRDIHGRGIEGVNVLIYDELGRIVATGLSSSDKGAYQTSGLPTGAYRVAFVDDPINYLRCAPLATQFYNATGGWTTANLVTVTAPYPTYGIDVIMGPGNIIAGRVISGTEGVANVDIAVSNLTNFKTDANGYYTTTALITGTYTLTPTKTGFAFSPITRTVSIPPDGTAQNFVVQQTQISIQNYLPLIIR